MTILVTGGCGYIGSQICYRLADLALPFVVIDDLSTGDRASVPLGTRVYCGDISDDGLIRRAFAENPIKTCIHLAAKKSVAESWSQAGHYYDNNLIKLTRLLELFCSLGGQRFVFSSSAAVYGETPSQLVSESFPCRPLNPYGRSKLAGEFVVSDICRANGVEFVAMRYFNVAGADLLARTGDRSPRGENLFNVIIDAIRGSRDYVPVFGTDHDTRDGTCVRDYVHVQDLADAHVGAVEYLDKGGKSATINCGYGEGYTVREVIDTFSKLSGKPIDTRDFPRRLGDPAEVVADVGLLRSLFHWSPKCADLTSIVRSELVWRNFAVKA
jgi:UDP-glucose 4-epimerase